MSNRRVLVGEFGDDAAGEAGGLGLVEGVSVGGEGGAGVEEGAEVADVLDDEDIAVGADLVGGGVFGTAADASAVDGDDGDLFVEQSVDELVAELGMMLEIGGGAVGFVFDVAGVDGDEHAGLDLVEVDVGEVDIAWGGVADVEDDAGAFEVVEGEDFVHDVKVGAKVPRERFLFVALRGGDHAGGDGEGEVDPHGGVPFVMRVLSQSGAGNAMLECAAGRVCEVTEGVWVNVLDFEVGGVYHWRFIFGRCV